MSQDDYSTAIKKSDGLNNQSKWLSQPYEITPLGTINQPDIESIKFTHEQFQAMNFFDADFEITQNSDNFTLTDSAMGKKFNFELHHGVDRRRFSTTSTEETKFPELFSKKKKIVSMTELGSLVSKFDSSLKPKTLVPRKRKKSNDKLAATDLECLYGNAESNIGVENI